MHRRKDVWGEDADEFNPEHFNPEQHSKRNPSCFMPFGGGYRMCIGWKYAMMMMKTVLAYSLRKYKFTTELKESDFRFQIDITMRLINKHLVKAEKRKW
jgi:cytochrome P450 family 313